MFSIEKMCNKDRKSDCGYALRSIRRPWRLLLSVNQLSAARNFSTLLELLKKNWLINMILAVMGAWLRQVVGLNNKRWQFYSSESCIYFINTKSSQRFWAKRASLVMIAISAKILHYIIHAVKKIVCALTAFVCIIVNSKELNHLIFFYIHI